jgi:hypothetical protein
MIKMNLKLMFPAALIITCSVSLSATFKSKQFSEKELVISYCNHLAFNDFKDFSTKRPPSDKEIREFILDTVPTVVRPRTSAYIDKVADGSHYDYMVKRTEGTWLAKNIFGTSTVFSDDIFGNFTSHKSLARLPELRIEKTIKAKGQTTKVISFWESQDYMGNGRNLTDFVAGYKARKLGTCSITYVRHSELLRVFEWKMKRTEIWGR